jgi:hypothetical protein
MFQSEKGRGERFAVDTDEGRVCVFVGCFFRDCKYRYPIAFVGHIKSCFFLAFAVVGSTLFH